MANQQRIGTHRTTVQSNEDLIRVVYHSTAVVTASRHGITLDSGGWRTATTKTRMNQTSNAHALGFQVYQRAGDWFVTFKGSDVPFVDGMILTR